MQTQRQVRRIRIANEGAQPDKRRERHIALAILRLTEPLAHPKQLPSLCSLSERA